MLCIPDITNYFDGPRRLFVEDEKVLDADYLSEILVSVDIFLKTYNMVDLAC